MTNKKKVLIVVENSSVPLDIRVWSEATALRDAEWQPIVICPVMDGQNSPVKFGVPEDLEGIPVYRFGLKFAENGIADYLREYGAAFIAIARLCWQLWRTERFDLIQFCNPPDVFFSVALFYRLLGARVIFDHHDLFPELILGRYHGLMGRFGYAIARSLEFLSMHSANVVISCNQSYSQLALNRGHLHSDRVFVVRNGPKRSQFALVDPVPGLKKGFPYMACYAGVMGREDGVLELIDSIRHVVCDRNRHDIRFVLLGDGPIRSEGLARLRRWGLETAAEMPGMIRDRLLLRQYLATSDVCLSPEPLTPLNACSTFIKVGEYMMMGKPTIAYDLAETHYTAQDAALYVKPGDADRFGDAIIDLIDDPDRRRRMGEMAQQRMMALDWEHQVNMLFQAYSRALA